MVAPIRDIGNIIFHSSAFHTSASNIASELDIDITDCTAVKNIIFNNSGEIDKVRGHSLTPSAHSSRSSSHVLDLSDEPYPNKVQRESNNMDEDNPVAPSDSP